MAEISAQQPQTSSEIDQDDPMEQVKSLASKFIWPDVSNSEGISRACLLGALALGWIGSTYVVSFVGVFSGGDLIGDAPNEGGWRALALSSLAGAAAAIAYLAVRIWECRCPIAAWVGLLWIGYETINALLGITPNNSFISLILLFAAFQGVRGCSVLSDPVDDG